MRSTDPGSHIVNIPCNANDEYRLMSDLSFDFGGLFGRTRSPTPFKFPSSITGTNLSFNFNGLCIDQRPQSSNTCFFAIHRGLVLVVYDDGNYLVHNPLTREFTRLPKPPSLNNQYQSKCSISLVEKTGFIMKGTRNTLSYGWIYFVLRVCRISKVIELYKSNDRPSCWNVSKLGLDEELIQACWCWENTVVLSEVHAYFLLTNKDRGVTIRVLRRPRVGAPPKVVAYGFALPNCVVQQGFQNARLGECRDYLHISYYNANGVWIWKHIDNGRTLTLEAWVPLFEISYHRQLCKPLAMECLGNVFKSGNLVVPLAFHPEAPIVFFRVKSWIVAYDNDNKDTFDKIADFGLGDPVSSSVSVFPYSPCLASPVIKRYGPFFKYSRVLNTVMRY
ncbi:uncharacterized protein LOC141596555 [Silene latifolia]|uniref:uncharacterized protein LOC141596555 n=1 Tax=Silene latifolia TaxID=37657 RepID=UPI003D789139